MRTIQYPLIAGVRLGRDTLALALFGGERIAIRMPDIIAAVDHLLRNLLTHNTLHHLINHLLLLLPLGAIGIQGLQFVAQVPMAQQHLVFRPQGFLLVFGTQATHIDVIPRDIVLRLSKSLGDTGIDLSRHTRGEHISQTRHRPLLTSPFLAQGILFLQAIMRKIDDGDKRQLVGKHIVREMRQRTVAGHDPIRFQWF